MLNFNSHLKLNIVLMFTKLHILYFILYLNNNIIRYFSHFIKCFLNFTNKDHATTINFIFTNFLNKYENAPAALIYFLIITCLFYFVFKSFLGTSNSNMFVINITMSSLNLYKLPTLVYKYPKRS